MRALVITEHGPPEVLQVQERPDPQPGPGQVRVRVRAAGINFADLLARVGLYPDAPKPPSSSATRSPARWTRWGRAWARSPSASACMGGCRFGGYAELAVAGRGRAAAAPGRLELRGGRRRCPSCYATAYAGLIRYGGLRSGERVLIQAAAGGVGIAATQIAKLLGAEVFGTASPPKHDAIRGFGVDHPIDYRTHDVVDEIRRITGEQEPLDLVFDAIGGRSFKGSFALLRPGGRLVCFGASEIQAGERRSRARGLRVLAQMPRFHPVKLMSESKSVIGLNMLKLWDAKRSLDEYIGPLGEWTRAARSARSSRLVPVGAKAPRRTATSMPARTSARLSWSRVGPTRYALQRCIAIPACFFPFFSPFGGNNAWRPPAASSRGTQAGRRRGATHDRRPE